MTRDEAIRILEQFFVDNEAQNGKDIWEASELGIKALKSMKEVEEKVGELRDILEGQVAFSKWQKEQLNKIVTIPFTIK